MMNTKIKGTFLILAAVAYLGVTPYLHLSSYTLGILSSAAALGLISLGVWLTLLIGRVNLGQSAFALIGAYTVAIATTRWDMSFWLALPLAGVVAGLMGAAIGVGVLRLRGVYFSMITLILTEAVRLVVLNGGSFTGGAVGISSIPVPGDVSVLGVNLIPDFSTIDQYTALFMLANGALLICLLLCWRLDRSPIGYLLRSMQQSEELARSLGINVDRLRVVVFAVGCVLGGVGGGYFAVSAQNVYPASFTVADSISAVLFCFLGGAGFVAGPIVGAFIMFLGFQWLHSFQEYQSLIYAGLIVFVMVWLPNGVLSLPGQVRGLIEKSKHEADARMETEVIGD